MTDVCSNDTCEETATLRCGACKKTKYCGSACQAAHWKSGHKKACKKAVSTKPAPKPPASQCTGCNRTFGQGLRCDQTCPDCGYKTCGTCSSSNSRGSCFCETKNFGHFYCDRVPKYYHVSSRSGRHYKGDRHPDSPWDLNAQKRPEFFEDEPRTCRTCGEVKLCMKEEYLSVNFPDMLF
ncbi:hypothetical protein BKA70DRAFT_1193290 [Coprinopsis sp. MPI-PUGE-AT-0042]|nr:hypothetical protein BKA70DRAFT_1193290 [Coprinopsis sp. MPI-PUGE-AT-0042]